MVMTADSLQDRQCVKYAVDLLSIRSANLCKTLYPDNPKMQALAGLFTSADNCFKIMTSNKFYDKTDKMKNSLRVNLEVQIPELNKMEDYLRKKNPFIQYSPAYLVKETSIQDLSLR